jgi:hypothetical protein
MREASACAEANLAAFERILEPEGIVEAAAAGKGPTAEEHLFEDSGLRELMAGLELSSRYGSSENAGSARNVRVWHQSTELDNVKSDDAAAAATARWAGEVALQNSTDTTTTDTITTDTTTTAAAGVRVILAPGERGCAKKTARDLASEERR